MVLSKMANGAPDFHFPERKNEVHRTLTLFFFFNGFFKVICSRFFQVLLKEQGKKNPFYAW